jgi:hypothetical protein
MFGNQDSAPGVDMGSFAVVGTLTSNTCGAAAFGVTSPYDFDIHLSKDGSAIYWVDGSPYIEGTVAADGTTFTISSTISSQTGTKSDGTATCELQRTTTLKGSLVMSSGKITSFSGTLTYDYAQILGGQCDEILGTQYKVTQIPCTQQFSVTATPD